MNLTPLIFGALMALLKLSILATGLLVAILIIAFVKSIWPRYKLVSLETKEKQVGSLPPSRRPTPRSALSAVYLDYELKELGRSLASDSQLHTPEHPDSSYLCHNDVQAIHKRLPWSETQLELESVDWINQTVARFWSFVKTIICRSMMETKPAKNGKSLTNRLNKQKDVPKLSIYLSCRRKLNLLRKARNIQGKLDSPSARTVNFIYYCVRKFIIYGKQFLIDQAVSLFESFSGGDGARDHTRVQSPKKIDLKEVVQANKLHLRMGKNCGATIKTNGADRTLNKGLESANESRGRLRTIVEPSNGLVALSSSNGLVSTQTRAVLRRRRLKLLGKITEARETIKGREGACIESFDIGIAAPRISGVKFIQDDNNLLLAETQHYGRRLAPSNDEVMHLLVELSYDSDENFHLSLSSIPILNRLRLVMLSFQVRLMLSLSRSASSLDNKDLEVFASPDEILFPIIDQAKVTLVDIVQLDWKIRRVTSKSMKSPLAAASSRRSLIGRHLDPIRIINHPYFKYLVQSLIYVIQAWLKPFDISLGERILIKTLY